MRALRWKALDVFTDEARAAPIKPENAVALRRRPHHMTPADLRRLHKYVLEIEKASAISGEMRRVVESEWPELAHKRPPKPQELK